MRNSPITPAEVKNFPTEDPRAKVKRAHNGMDYVVMRVRVPKNDGTGGNRYKDLYLGRVINGEFISMEDLHRLYEKNGTRREVPLPRRRTVEKEEKAEAAPVACPSGAPGKTADPRYDALNFLLTRRSLKPKKLTDPAPTMNQLKTAARTALRAPDHGELRPYRFVAIREEDRSALGELLAGAAARRGASPDKVEKSRSKAFKGPAIAAFIARIDPKEREVPADEQLVTAGAALQQFLLALKAQGFGSIVLSGSVFEDNLLQRAFCRKPGEVLLCWITMGTPEKGEKEPKPETGKPPLSVWNPPEAEPGEDAGT